MRSWTTSGRSNIALNHTMTHVLNYALRAVLGDGVDQKGSLVDDEKLRFDFSHTKAMTVEQIKRVEAIVNDMVGKKLPVDAREVALADAQKISGLRAVFGEVYPDPVRVVSVGPAISDLLSDPSNDDWKQFSIEFCGGTHLANTGEADDFVILSEEGIAKGIRRVVGATRGAAAAALAAADEVAARVKACDGLSGAELEKEMACSRASSTPRSCPRLARGSSRRADAITKAMIARGEGGEGGGEGGGCQGCRGEGGGGQVRRRRAVRRRLSDGTDPAALKDAAAVAFKAGVACALFACDPVKGKAMCYVSVPPAVEGIDVKGWLDACCGPIGGKGGGGKGGTAQGQGNNTDGLDAAVAAAEAFAAK